MMSVEFDNYSVQNWRPFLTINGVRLQVLESRTAASLFYVRFCAFVIATSEAPNRRLPPLVGWHTHQGSTCLHDTLISTREDLPEYFGPAKAAIK